MILERSRYINEFKLEAIQIVEERGRKRPEVSSLDIVKTTLESWVYKYRKEQQGITPTKGSALTE